MKKNLSACTTVLVGKNATIDGSTMKELQGKGCYCIHYVEKWEDGQQHFEELQIVCQVLQNGPVSFENPWK